MPTVFRIDSHYGVHGYDGLCVIAGSVVCADQGVSHSLEIAALAERAMSKMESRLAHTSWRTTKMAHYEKWVTERFLTWTNTSPEWLDAKVIITSNSVALAGIITSRLRPGDFPNIEDLTHP